jgi:hypothetical protein
MLIYETRSRDSSVGITLSYGLDDRGFESRQGLGIFLFTTASRPALGPTQPPIQWVPGALSLGVKRPGRQADYSPVSSAEVKECMDLYFHSTPQYARTASFPIYSSCLVFYFVQEEYQATSYELSADGLYLLIGYDQQAVCIMTLQTVITRSWRVSSQYVFLIWRPLLFVARVSDIQLSPGSLSSTSLTGACSHCIVCEVILIVQTIG